MYALNGVRISTARLARVAREHRDAGYPSLFLSMTLLEDGQYVMCAGPRGPIRLELAVSLAPRQNKTLAGTEETAGDSFRFKEAAA